MDLRLAAMHGRRRDVQLRRDVAARVVRIDERRPASNSIAGTRRRIDVQPGTYESRNVYTPELSNRRRRAFGTCTHASPRVECSVRSACIRSALLRFCVLVSNQASITVQCCWSQPREVQAVTHAHLPADLALHGLIVHMGFVDEYMAGPIATQSCRYESGKLSHRKPASLDMCSLSTQFIHGYTPARGSAHITCTWLALCMRPTHGAL